MASSSAVEVRRSNASSGAGGRGAAVAIDLDVGPPHVLRGERVRRAGARQGWCSRHARRPTTAGQVPAAGSAG